MQTKIAAKKINEIGEHVGLELGTQMVKAYFDKYPDQGRIFMVGKDIIEQILAQPGCEGIGLATALDEEGRSTLVYLGLDAKGKPITEYAEVNELGEISLKEAIVADRILPPPFPNDPNPPTTPTTLDWF